MTDSKRAIENPLGPESPTVSFAFRQWHVLVALLVVAIGLTAWKQYEYHYLAPNRPVTWQPFSVEQAERALRSGRDVILVVSSPPDQKNSDEARHDDPEFRRAVYLSGAVTMQIESVESIEQDHPGWLSERLLELPQSGFLVCQPDTDNPRDPETAFRITPAATTTDVVRLLDSTDPETLRATQTGK